jgi:integrase
MRGSVVKRGASYSVVVELDRDPATGKRRQKWHSGYRTRRDAERALAEMVDAVNRGAFVPKTRQTVREFAKEWLAAIEPTVRPATHYNYGRNLRLHVEPYIGGAVLTKVDAGTLNGLYARLLADGRRSAAEGGLSPRSVQQVHGILHKMLKDAVKWGRLARNPADAADPPRAAGKHAAMVTWDATETARFLTAVKDDRLAAAFLTLATTGARRGEVLGLRWSDVDLENGRAAIRQTVITVNNQAQIGEPKTARGRRTIDLDAATVAALREHRKRQAAERLLMGSGWTDHGLVFCRVDGSPLRPGHFSRAFSRHIRRLGLRPIRLHDLRHGWATLALAAGEHPKVVQERLGHANISITLDTYSHVTASLHRQAAERVAALIFGGGETVG